MLLLLTLPMLLVAVSVPPVSTPEIASADPRGSAADAAPGGRAARWEASAAVVSETPAVLPGLAVGAAGELSRHLGRGPWFVSTQLAVTSASGATASFTIDHRQMKVALGVGAESEVGVGKLWIQAGGGLLGLEEVLGRHQLERIQMADLGGGTVSSFGLGPLGFAEVGVALRIRDDVRVRLCGGVAVSRIELAGAASSWRLGGTSKLGIAYAF